MNQWQRCKRNPQLTSAFHQILPNQYNAKQNLDCWSKNSIFKITLEIGLKIKISFFLGIRWFNPSSFWFFFSFYCMVFLLSEVLCGKGVLKWKIVKQGITEGKRENASCLYIFAGAVSSPAVLLSVPAARPFSRQWDRAFGRSWRLEFSRCDVCLVLWKLQLSGCVQKVKIYLAV